MEAMTKTSTQEFEIAILDFQQIIYGSGLSVDSLFEGIKVSPQIQQMISISVKEPYIKTNELTNHF